NPLLVPGHPLANPAPGLAVGGLILAPFNGAGNARGRSALPLAAPPFLEPYLAGLLVAGVSLRNAPRCNDLFRGEGFVRWGFVGGFGAAREGCQGVSVHA